MFSLGRSGKGLGVRVMQVCEIDRKGYFGEESKYPHWRYEQCTDAKKIEMK